MNAHKKEFKKTSQSIQTVTANHNQQQNEADVVSIKDCISSNLTSPLTFSRDVTADFAGEMEVNSR